MTSRTTQRLARLLATTGVLVFARALATHHSDPATAAESAYLGVLAGAVLAALTLCSRATPAVVAAALWVSVCLVLPAAGGTRGAFVVAGLVAAVAWASWCCVAATGGMRRLDAAASTLAWVTLLRSPELVPLPALEAAPEMLGPPLLLAAAAAYLSRSLDGWRLLAALGPLLLVSGGDDLVAGVALLALGVAGSGRPALWGEIVALAAAAALALMDTHAAGVPLLVLVAALALERQPGWRWLPAAGALVWVAVGWSGPPGAGVWLLVAVPFAAVAGRERWSTLAAAVALTAGIATPAAAFAAPAVGLLLVASVPDGRALRRQAAWGLALLGLGSVAAAYPWARDPWALPPEGLPEWASSVVVPATLALLALLWRRGGRTSHRAVAWLGAVALATPLVHLAATARPLLGEPFVLSPRTAEWSLGTPAAPVRVVAIDSFLMNGAAVADGTPVARVRLKAADGTWRETTLRATEDTADWAARRLARAHPEPWLRWVAADGSLAQRYRVRWRLEEPTRSERIEVARAEGLPPTLEIAVLQVTVR